jgi:hypothetical protein
MGRPFLRSLIAQPNYSKGAVPLIAIPQMDLQEVAPSPETLL